MSSPPSSFEREDRSVRRPGGGSSSSRPVVHPAQSRRSRSVATSAGGTIDTSGGQIGAARSNVTITTAASAAAGGVDAIRPRRRPGDGAVLRRPAVIRTQSRSVSATSRTGRDGIDNTGSNRMTTGGGRVDANRPGGPRANDVGTEVAAGFSGRPPFSASPTTSAAVPADEAVRRGGSASARAPSYSGAVPEVFPPQDPLSRSTLSKPPHSRSHLRTSSREKAAAAASAAKVAGRDGHEPPSKPRPRPEVASPQAPPQTPHQTVIGKAEPRPEVVDAPGPPQNPRTFHGGPRLATTSVGGEGIPSPSADVSADRRHRGSSPSSEPPARSVRGRGLLPFRGLQTVRAWAVPVQEEEDEAEDDAPLAVATTPLAVATRMDDICGFNFRNRRVQFVIGFFAAVVVALAVGLGFALSGGGGSERTVSDGPQQPQTEDNNIFQRPSEVTPHQPTFLPTRSPTSPPTKLPTSSPTLPPTPQAFVCLAETLLPSDGSSVSIGFGYAVGVSKSVVAVGAPYSDDNGEYSGSVSVYFHTGSGFTFQQKILPGDGAAGDRFGFSVAVDDNVIAVGAPDRDNNRGAVYIFVWDGSTWKERQKLVPQDSSEGDYFGWSVDLDEDQLIVGAPQGTWTIRGRGKAYIFALKGLTWEEEAHLHPGDGASDDASFGRSVALRNGTALVGAPRDDTDKGADSGSVFIYEYDASVDASSSSPWKEAVKILPEDGSAGDKRFGISVDLVEDGSKALIGAESDDSQGTDSGSAYVLVRGGSTWTEERKLLPKDGAAHDYFGRSANLLSKSVAVVGAPWDDDNGDWSGSAYLLIMEEDGGWTQKDKIAPADGEPDDEFGWSLAVDEGIVAVGTRGPDKVFVYELC